MSGFDNGSVQQGLYAQTKKAGPILRGFGPPAPTSGVLGDVYIDTNTFQLYVKRENTATSPWGNYLYVVPIAYRTTLKWFTNAAPEADVGAPGDYMLLLGDYSNYGLLPSIYGPKGAVDWPENGEGPAVAIASPGTILPIGLLDEGGVVNISASSQLVAIGLTSEVILPIPVRASAGDPVIQEGLQSGPVLVEVEINPVFTAVNQATL